MKRYSPPGYSPPRRDYGGRGRSPPRRAYGGGGGGGGRRREQNGGSLLVRNIPLDCSPEELRIPFERFGIVRDVYIPKDYYTGDPRGFAFVQFVDAQEASDAQHHLNGKNFAGREIAVVVASETRKRPEEMRQRTGTGRGSGPRHGDRRSSYYGRSRKRSVSRSRSRSPQYESGPRSRHRSRSYSPAPKRRDDYSASPGERLRDHPREREQNGRSYSPRYDGAAELNPNTDRKPSLEPEDRQHNWRSRGRTSRSPSGSRPRR